MEESGTQNFECPICGSGTDSIKFYGINDCNHSTCGACAIKLSIFNARSSDGDINYSLCSLCKKETKEKYISTKNSKFPETFQTNILHDKEYGLIFEDIHAKSYYEKLIEVACSNCYKKFESKDDLNEHLHYQHQLRFCELCLEHTKCLLKEQVLYDNSKYHYHRNEKHPKCTFCNERFYEDSYLIKHVKQNHFLCDICHRRHGFTAYKSQKELFNHYFNDHYVCDICKGNNYVNVFSTDADLKIHRASQHGVDLANEGLVNVQYPNDNRRNYSHRRRRAENEQFTNELLNEGATSNAEVSLPLPSFECEQEFPRLGQTSRLGAISHSNDVNDARNAFNEIHQCEEIGPNVAKNEVQSNKINTTTQNLITNTTMAHNFAHSAKLNDGDFPALGNVSQQKSSKQNSSYGSTANKATIKSSDANKQLPKVPDNPDDFPALPGRGNNKSQTSSGPKWPKKPTEQKVTKSSISKPPKSESYSSTGADFPVLSASFTKPNEPIWSQTHSNLKQTAIIKPKSSSLTTNVELTKPNYVNTSNNTTSDFKAESLKGIDYLPSTQAPVKQSIQVVNDEKNFRELKHNIEKQNTNNNGTKSSNLMNNYQEDFPDTLGGRSNGKNNVTHIVDFKSFGKIQKVSKEIEKISETPHEVIPKIENPEEFPGLESAKIHSSYIQSSENTKKTKRNSHKNQKHSAKTTNKSVEEKTQDTINSTNNISSLDEIGAKYGNNCSLINLSNRKLRNYSIPINSEDRNSMLYINLIEHLGETDAKQCLSVASRYRKGTCTVNDLLNEFEKLSTDLLAEMIVLLPNIQLQQNLLQAIDNLKNDNNHGDWASCAIKILKKCNVCGQVLLVEDNSQHTCSFG